MIVAQQLVKEVDSLIAHEALVLGVDKAVPGLPLEAAEDVVILGVELYLVLVEVIKQLIGAKDLSDLDQLVGVAAAMEEGLLAEDHGRKHGAETPHVEAVVIFLIVYQQLGTLEVARCNADVVLRARVIEFRQTPVDQSQLRQRQPRPTVAKMRLARSKPRGYRKLTFLFSWSIITLCGLTSRCMIPLLWQKSRALSNSNM